MAMQVTDIDLHCGFVLPTMALRFLFTGSGSKIYFHQATKDRRILLITRYPLLMLTDCNHCYCRLLHYKFT